MPTKTVHLHLIRHGYSCANAVKATNDIPIWNLIAHHLYSDPDLTEVSVDKVRDAAAANKTKFDLVVTSPLLRAIKTGAIYARHNRLDTVYSTPYLNELTDYPIAAYVGLNQDNTAEAAQLQKAYIENDRDYNGITIDTSARGVANAIPVQVGQVNANYAALVDHVVGMVCGLRKSEVHVAVVGHSHYFKKLVDGLEHTPNGTELAVYTLTVNTGRTCAHSDEPFRVTSSEWGDLKRTLKESGTEGCARRWATESEA